MVTHSLVLQEEALARTAWQNETWRMGDHRSAYK